MTSSGKEIVTEMRKKRESPNCSMCVRLASERGGENLLLCIKIIPRLRVELRSLEWRLAVCMHRANRYQAIRTFTLAFPSNGSNVLPLHHPGSVVVC